jgi:hypothetical protein
MIYYILSRRKGKKQKKQGDKQKMKQEIKISLGKINTNKVKECIRNLEWKGRTRTELSSYLDYSTQEYKENSSNLTEIFGEIDNDIKLFLNSLYERLNYEINESNFKAFIEEVLNYTENYKYKVVDKRQTEEELLKEKEEREKQQKEEQEQKEKEEAEIKAKGDLTKSEKINLSTKEIAKKIRTQLKEEFKNLKFSVTKESYSGGSSITISLMEGDIKVFRTFEELTQEAKDYYMINNNYSEENLKALCSEKYAQLNQYALKDDFDLNKWCNGHFLTKEAHNILSKVVDISNYYNYDNSDIQSDYFDVNYYMHLNVGSYEKPYKRIETKVKQETKQENNSLDFSFNHNTNKNGLEIYFKAKPKEEILNILKENGFRWGRFNKCWYKKYSENLQEEIKNKLMEV